MSNYIFLIAPITGWVSAQFIKVLLDLREDGVQLSDAIASGGMPSSHTAGIAALTTVIGVQEGLDSAIFGLAFTLLVVIIYDSAGVRRTTGENALALRKIEKKLQLEPQQKIHIARGHSPEQVLAGLILGAIIGVILTNLL